MRKDSRTAIAAERAGDEAAVVGLGVNVDLANADQMSAFIEGFHLALFTNRRLALGNRQGFLRECNIIRLKGVQLLARLEIAGRCNGVLRKERV